MDRNHKDSPQFSDNFTPKKGFKLSFPSLVDEEEEWRNRKGQVRRTYIGLFFICLLISSIYFYNLDPVKELPQTASGVKTMIASYCAKETPHERKVGDIEFTKSFYFFFKEIDHGCEGLDKKLRDEIFINYKNGNTWFISNRSGLNALCLKTCLALRGITYYDLKNCKTKECVRAKFNLVLSEKDNLNSVKPWNYRGFDELMRNEPEMVQAIYQELIKRYP